MKKLVFVGLLFGMAMVAFGGGSVTYSKEAVTKEIVHKILSDKYNATRDDDGDTIIVNSGMKILVMANLKREFVSFHWAAKASGYSRSDKLALCQKYNQEKVFVRFFLDKEDDYAADYQMAYDGGLNSDNLKGSVEWFCKVLEDFVKAAQELKERE